ncbi:MAG: hypothetical protein HUJ76_00840 [Parasporobacterium sp.]|nr:hypothetical protein [Parasporobacterium sp.]
MKKRKIGNKTIRTFIIVILTAAAVFAAINLAWVFMILMPYKHYEDIAKTHGELRNLPAKPVTEEVIDDHVSYENEDYTFSLYDPPKYLDFGNIYLSTGRNSQVAVPADSEGNAKASGGYMITMRITRPAVGKTVQTLDIWDPSNLNEGGVVKINRNLEIIPWTAAELDTSEYGEAYYENMERIIEEQMDTIKPLVDFGYDLWELKD